MTEIRTIVFVYGTLKQGHRNNYILEKARYLGRAETVGRHRLYHAGFPVMRERDDWNKTNNARVAGEVYLVTDMETLRRLDQLESEGRMYHRRTKHVRMERNGKVLLAEAYVGDARYWNERRVHLYQKMGERYSWPSEVAL